MSKVTCAICDRGFAARSDAVYCSPACSQKAHRDRAARRTAELRERLTARSGIDASTPLRRAVAASLQRARKQVDLARELCRQAERGRQRTAAIRQATSDKPPAGSRRAARGERGPWPGN